MLMPCWRIYAQKSLGRMLRMALWIPVFAALFGPVSDRAAGVHTVYYTFLRVRTSVTGLRLMHLCCSVSIAPARNWAADQSAWLTQFGEKVW